MDCKQMKTISDEEEIWNVIIRNDMEQNSMAIQSEKLLSQQILAEQNCEVVEGKSLQNAYIQLLACFWKMIGGKHRWTTIAKYSSYKKVLCVLSRCDDLTKVK